MTDETLTTVLLLSHERGHTGQSRVTESTCTAGHRARKGNQEVAGVVHSARLCAVSQHSPSGTCTTLIKHFNSQQNLCRFRQLTTTLLLRQLNETNYMNSDVQGNPRIPDSQLRYLQKEGNGTVCGKTFAKAHAHTLSLEQPRDDG